MPAISGWQPTPASELPFTVTDSVHRLNESIKVRFLSFSLEPAATLGLPQEFVFRHCLMAAQDTDNLLTLAFNTNFGPHDGPKEIM